jgi:hypothetical protein
MLQRFSAHFTQSKWDCFAQVALQRLVPLKLTDVATITPETATNTIAKDLPKTTNLLEGIDYYLENGNYVFLRLGFI